MKAEVILHCIQDDGRERLVRQLRDVDWNEYDTTLPTFFRFEEVAVHLSNGSVVTVALELEGKSELLKLDV